MTINWDEGWFTTVLDQKTLEHAIRKKYPDAIIVPRGVQQLVYRNKEELGKNKTVASVMV